MVMRLIVFILLWMVLWPLFGSPRAAAAASPPAVDGEIVSFATSPDRTRMILYFEKGAGAETVGTAALLDLKKRALLAQVPVAGCGRVAWTDDSSFAAFLAPSQGVVVFTRQGRVTKVPLADARCGVLWRDGRPGRLVTLTMDDGQRITEIDVAAKKELTLRRARKGAVFSRLFNIRGRTCYSWYALTEVTTAAPRILRAAYMDSGKDFFALPLYGLSLWDVYDLDLSPDGRFFFLTGLSSASTYNILGAAEDAPVLFRKPRLALLYQVTVEDTWQLAWPLPAAKDPDLSGAIVQPGGECAFRLDLRTGDRRPLTWNGTYTLGDHSYYLTKEGLEENGYSAPEPVLRHTPRKK